MSATESFNEEMQGRGSNIIIRADVSYPAEQIRLALLRDKPMYGSSLLDKFAPRDISIGGRNAWGF